MRPEVLGEKPTLPNTSESEKKQLPQEESDELNAFEQVKTTEIDAEETGLLRQAFMLNPSQTIYDYVTSHEAELVDFVRCELDKNEN
ncbi:unnamed protein product [Caenorhabditis auriculariae]|uniref:Uncharacterized protein n=1 Tax=Caenorhabditis auriculariae TaxID=2777116 RepID=A0A8S1H300_9PELO|nr:unnamed protein product [Caenorhabditis auriculariae]